jgi:23S rRNA-/tRNA-specific pseudouridylate synthase
LEADTTGILLLARSPGAVTSDERRFESRRMKKIYLAVVKGVPKPPEWICKLKPAPDPKRHVRLRAPVEEFLADCGFQSCKLNESAEGQRRYLGREESG